MHPHPCHHPLRALAVILMIAASGGLLAGQGVKLRVVASHERVFITQKVPRTIAKSLTLTACRNEWESAQVVATGMAAELGQLSFTFDRPTHVDGTSFPVPRLYWEYDVAVSKSSPNAPLPARLYPDALLPFGNGAQPDPRAFRGIPGEVNFRVWLDFKIPTDQPAGIYRCKCTLRNSATMAAVDEAEIIVMVLPETLPVRPSLKSFFGLGEHGIARMNQLDRNDDGIELARIMADYYQLMLDSRIEPGLVYATSAPIGDRGQIVWASAAGANLPAARDTVRNYFGRKAFQSLHLPVWRDYPYADPLGKDRARAVRYMAALARLNQTAAPDARLFFSVGRLDEPDDKEAYQRVRQWAALVQDASALAETKISFFLTEQPEPQNPRWGTLVNSVDIWAPHVMWAWEDLESRSGKRVIAGRIAAGEEVWTYPALCQFRARWRKEKGMPDTLHDAFPPVWLTDYPAVHFRILPWICAAHGLTGIHYWNVHKWPESVNPWNDAGTFVIGNETFNGDGFLIYPPAPAALRHGLAKLPCPSIRLKWIRDGMEDYDHIVLLKRKHPEKAAGIIATIARGFADWETSVSKIPQARISISKMLNQHPQHRRIPMR